MNAYYKGEPVSLGGNGPLFGMKICALGDSNTQYMGDNLNNRVVELTGCARVDNFGAAGATWGMSDGDKTATSGGNAVARVNQLCNPFISQGYSDQYDIVTLMYGTNGDASIGDSTSTSVATTWGAMKYCFDKLLYYFRFGKVAVFLPPQRAFGIMTESVAAVKECCELYSIPYYDMSGQGQIANDRTMPESITEQNLPNDGYGQIYFADNVHFGTPGRDQFYHKYARFLESII